MKLLFDANLAPSLVHHLADCYGASDHVFNHGLEASDERIWDFAAANGLAIVTQDDDFVGLSLVSGPPPKVILLRIGNCRTRVVEGLLRSEIDVVRAFLESADEGLLVLNLPKD